MTDIFFDCSGSRNISHQQLSVSEDYSHWVIKKIPGWNGVMLHTLVCKSTHGSNCQELPKGIREGGAHAFLGLTLDTTIEYQASATYI